MPSDVLSTWKASLGKGLRALKDRHQLRSLAQIHGVNFCSNDYLGLAQHPALRAATVQAVQNSSRVGGTGSRLLSGQTEDWHHLESTFATFAGTQSALFFGSGYAANMGLLSSLLTKDDSVYSDSLNHASLIDGIRLSGARKTIYPHLDLDFLETALRQEAGAPWRRVVVTETIFSMDGDVAPLQQIAALAEKYGAALIVDEAHATAVHGPAGRGLAVQAGIHTQLLASVHTCGKALACAGAFVCGPVELKQHLINHARTFIFSTALPPYFAHQIAAALEISATMDADRHSLLDHASRFCKTLRAAGFDVAAGASQIIPVVLGANDAALSAADHLQRDGFAVRAIRPPTVPDGRSRLRLSLTTLISEDELHRLAQSLSAWHLAHQLPAIARHA
ncbi:MAG TPA: 8-amino-7-oxononanoate synthase [Candidatus Acidoferrum sp.]